MEFLDEDALNLNDPPRLAWVQAQDAVALLWRENPKLHDIPELADSIRRHSFQEPGKFDSNLFRVGQPDTDVEPLGAIKAGNGRYEAVAWLETHWEQVKADEEDRPRGLGLDATGAWVVPILIGTDAKSLSAAMEYAIDSNNLVLSGGDLDAFDMARLWDPAYYAALIGSLDKLGLDIEKNCGIIGRVTIYPENYRNCEQVFAQSD